MEIVKSDFLKPVEASAALKISRSKVYEALARGQIPSVKIAGLTRIPRRWIEDRIREALTTASGPDGEAR
jgi:excisionase family DNA binding protein